MAKTEVSLANYSAYRRAGDLVYFSGLIAADPVKRGLVLGFSDLPESDREAAGETGLMSVDAINGPMAAQTWHIFRTLSALLGEVGGALEDVVHLNQYFTDIREFPVYSQVRDSFFDVPPASTCLEVSRMLPSPDMCIEVQATAYVPLG